MYIGDLASVPDEQTQEFLAALTSKTVYIGGRLEEGSWVWSDGTPWQYEVMNYFNIQAVTWILK